MGNAEYGLRKGYVMSNMNSNVVIRKSSDRGVAALGWLHSQHSFSFGDYYDPAHMGFRSLRVINQDQVAPGGGFPTHPHRDMEIFSYVLEGSLAHKDSMGNGRVLQPGQIQLMSAGSGVTHSEFNPSQTEAAHFLQIWLQPNTIGLTPSYTEWHPDQQDAEKPKVLVISPDGRDRSAVIHQDAFIYRVRLKEGERIEHPLHEGRGLWLQIISGSIHLDTVPLSPGDGASVETTGAHNIHATANSEALLFDLA